MTTNTKDNPGNAPGLPARRENVALSAAELEALNRKYEATPAEELLRWALETFHPDMALACSFSAEDVVLVDLLARTHKRPRVFYLDTDFHFSETYDVRERILARYNVELIRCATKLSVEEQARLHGPELYRSNPDLCCQLRKVEPMREMLRTLRAWITGIRREQARTRAQSPLIEWDKKFELLKLNPLIYWHTEDVWQYIRAHRVPYNTLHDRNYPSIGCAPCTRPVQPSEDSRAGRWPGLMKIECGLHK